MIYLALVCVALLAFCAYVVRQHGLKEQEWFRERQLLLTRIQHPEIVIPQPEAQAPEDFQTAPEPDDIDLIGTVQTDGG